jgi:TonB family protein
MDFAMQMLLIAAKATVLLGVAILFLYLMRSRSTAASRHFVCISALAALFLLIATAFVPAEGLTGNWPVFPVSIGARAAASQAASWTGWSNAVFLIWLVGSGAFALRLFLGRQLVAAKSRRFAPVHDAASHADLASAAARLGVPASRVTLREGNVATPVVSGIFRPAILLPQGARLWDSFHRQTVLLHELAHVRRRDCLWQQIAGLACALFWFHPLAWRVAARMCREQELACDDLALSAGIDRRAYADLLLNAAQNTASSKLFACAFQGPSSVEHLRARFANILESPASRRVQRHWAKAFATALVCSLLALGSVKLARAAHVYRIGKDVSAPVLISKVEPEYTKAARKAKIAGTVHLSAIITKNGHARKVHVTKGIDPGLNANAVKAITQWRFHPAMRKGKPVAVHVNIEVNFRLL